MEKVFDPVTGVRVLFAYKEMTPERAAFLEEARALYDLKLSPEEDEKQLKALQAYYKQ